MFPLLLRGLVLTFVLVFSACGGGDSDGDARAERSDTESVESPSPSSPDTEESLAPGVSPTSEGTLAPGRYQTGLFEPSATFKVARGWQVPFEGSNHLVLARKLEPKDEVIYLDSSQQTLDVRAALEYAQDAFAGTTGVAGDFGFSQPTAVQIGVFSGRSITMEVRTDQLAVTLAMGIEAYEVRPDDRLELNAIDVNGKTVFVFVEAPGARFAAFHKQAEQVLESLSF